MISQQSKTDRKELFSLRSVSVIRQIFLHSDEQPIHYQAAGVAVAVPVNMDSGGSFIISPGLGT